MPQPNQLVPYERVSPGFEAVYIGDKKAKPDATTDDEGNVLRRWSTYAAWAPDKPEAWDDEIKHLNRMQTGLGPLDEGTRQIRAHIGTLEICDVGLPVCVDEILLSIGSGQLQTPSFRAGCRHGDEWWVQKTTAPRQIECMRAIHAVLTDYLAGCSAEETTRKYPYACGLVNRAHEWLGPPEQLSEVQRLMLQRILLLFDFFTKQSHTVPRWQWTEEEAELSDQVFRDCFEDGGRGSKIDEEISRLAGLPPICAEYKKEFSENLKGISEPRKKELYRLCGAIGHGVRTLSDCHHSAFRWIERWIHAIGTGQWHIPGRKEGAERKRLGRLLYGYCVALDKWLLKIPMQFLLLDFGHADLGSDPKNEITRVYAYLGEKRTAVEEWLAACLWHNLNSHANKFPEWRRAEQVGLGTGDWMRTVLAARGEADNNCVERTRKTAPLKSDVRQEKERSSMLRKTVVADNEHYQDDPDVVLTRNGALVCVYREADALVPTWASVMVTVSKDFGETWSPAHVLAKSSKAQDGYCWDSPRVSVLPSGQLAVVANYFFDDDAEETSIWMWRSDDDGRTWSEPSRVIPEGIAPDRICALPSGRLLLNADCDISDERPQWQELYMSDDNGASWQKLSTIIRPPGGRASIVVFDENTIVCYLGRAKIDFHCLKAVSRDSGKTWSTTHTPIIAHRPCAGLLSSGKMLVTYRFPGAGTYAYLEEKESALSLEPDKQQGLLIQLENGGNNYWWDYGYSGWTQLPDSRVFCVYYAKQPTTRMPPQTPAPSIRGVWFSEDDFTH